VTVLSVRGYRKVYRETVAVEGLDLELQGGEVLGMVGPNGAGKTTTLRAIAGIFPPTSGHLEICGADIVRDPIAAKRLLAYVPDDPHLFEALTVWEHILFIASAYRVEAYEARATSLLERFDLLEYRDRPAQALSRGMRQKLALCCAWLHAPRLVMLDEPMTGLDPRGIRTLKEFVREERARGTTVVISSHQLDLVEDLATHLLILTRGKVRFFGTLDEAYASLQHERTGRGDLEGLFFRATEADDGPAGPA
jgi:ABC-2 type transport system ATP-binding protein